MRGKTLMIQGTGSGVGKTTIVAGICRLLVEDGFRVAPYKAQNMALNSFVTPEGGEIGRAQAMQAEACKIAPHVDMNPILMKPYEDTSAQIIFCGRPAGNMNVSQYAAFKKRIFPSVLQSLNRLRNDFDVVVIEGAGSPAEINLREQDIVNMPIALAADAPVVLVGDIGRGGVFASLVGTIELLQPEERELVSAFLINKFRGDASLLDNGIEFLRQRTGKQTLGIIPYLHDPRLAEEDALSDRNSVRNSHAELTICVLLLPHISNFTDFDPLELEPDVQVRYVKTPSECEGADLLILPGSKSTMSDYLYIEERGFVSYIQRRKSELVVLGICAGFQMLGKQILDPHCIESQLQKIDGLGLIPATTQFEREKFTRQVSGYCIENNFPVRGYEIHHGTIAIEDTYTPLFVIYDTNGAERAEGYSDPKHGIYATSIHGIFEEHLFRRAFLNRLRERKGLPPRSAIEIDRDLPYRQLSGHLRRHIHIDRLYELLNL